MRITVLQATAQGLINPIAIHDQVTRQRFGAQHFFRHTRGARESQAKDREICRHKNPRIAVTTVSMPTGLVGMSNQGLPIFDDQFVGYRLEPFRQWVSL